MNRLNLQPAHELYKAPQELAAVEDDHRAADLIDDIENFLIELAAQQRHHRGQGQKPQDRGAAEAEDEGQVTPRREGGPEGTQHHGAVYQGLGVHPGDHEGGGEQLPDGNIYILAAL